MLFIALVLTLAPIVRAFFTGEPFYDAGMDAIANGATALLIFSPIFLVKWILQSPRAYAERYRVLRAIPPDELQECINHFRARKGTFYIIPTFGVKNDDPVHKIVEVLKVAAWTYKNRSTNSIPSGPVGVTFECKDAEVLLTCRNAFGHLIPDISFLEVPGLQDDLRLTIGNKGSPKP